MNSSSLGPRASRPAHEADLEVRGPKNMRLRRFFIASALAVAVVATAGLALDRLFPPDLERYQARSTEVVDANGRLLRAFTT
jgi:hypothetical protein